MQTRSTRWRRSVNNQETTNTRSPWWFKNRPHIHGRYALHNFSCLFWLQNKPNVPHFFVFQNKSKERHIACHYQCSSSCGCPFHHFLQSLQTWNTPPLSTTPKTKQDAYNNCKVSKQYNIQLLPCVSIKNNQSQVLPIARSPQLVLLPNQSKSSRL